MKAIVNAKFITNQDIIRDKILLFGDKIVGFVDEVSSDIEVIDAKGGYVSAGFIDIHIHGSGGADVMDATPKALDLIGSSILKYGTTSYLATTMTMSKESILNALENIRKYNPNQSQANLLGIHMEGPFINPIKAGAQDSTHIIKASIQLIEAYSDIVKMITLAPEVYDNIAFVKQLHKQYPNILLSIGHSNATYDEAIEGFNCGISHATHMFNAMPPYHHRQVGLIGAVLDRDDISCDVIADIVHTHASTLGLLYRLKQNSLMLITDAMRAGCMRDGRYDLGGQLVSVVGDKAILQDGTLAGSVLTLNKAVNNMLKHTNATLIDVISMVTSLPAKKLGLNKGLLEIGYDADIVIFDDEIDIKLSIISGDIVYIKE